MLQAVEREKLQDCLLLVQSAQSILSGIRPGVIPEANKIVKCFNDVNSTIRKLLRA